MLETALTAFTTFFAVIGPIDSAVLLTTLTPNATRDERRALRTRATRPGRAAVTGYPRAT